MTKYVVLVGLVYFALFLVPSANAGLLVQDGQVTMVSNTTGNQSQYKVDVVGGTGLCADTTLIFNEARAGDHEVFKRGFAVALTALATRLPVTVYSYDDDNCYSSAYIHIRD